MLIIGRRFVSFYITPIGVFIPLLPLHFLLLVHDVKAIAATNNKIKLSISIFLRCFMFLIFTKITNCVPKI